jgi:c-di-GMP-binding flagellar brake protein YcgR
MDNKDEFQPGNIKFERRRFKRIDGNYVVSYVPVEGEELKSDISQTKNLSEGGLLFVSDRAFEKGITLKIKLRLPEFSDYVIIKAKVVDSKKIGKGTMYNIGAQFVEVEQKVKDAIKRLVEHAK